VQHVADRKGHDQRYALDDTRIRTELGYRPRVALAEGLAETVGWYRANPGWWRPLRRGGP
jgi:dTDP-glucose 4,6-dehydratase